MFRHLSTCVINQTISSDAYVLGSQLDPAVEQFFISKNEEVKFLPRHIGDKFPNVKTFRVYKSGITVLREFYFKNMRKLQYLYLDDNQIATIEPSAFRDLISLKKLELARNMIQSLDEQLFVTMVNLDRLNLDNNKIKFLRPTTFNIPGGKLRSVDLESNVCIDGYYNSDSWKRLETTQRMNCL